jgi:hypothetical protein
MKPVRDIDKQVRQLRLQASRRLDDRVHDDLDQALAGQQSSATSKKGRTIMIGSVTKLTAAAAVILAVMLGLNVIDTPGTGSVAWAQVPDLVAQVDTFIFSLTIRVGDNGSVPPGGQHDAQWIFYLSEEYGFRMDMGGDGQFVSWYVAPQSETMVTVIPGEKTWFESPVPEGQRDKMPEEYQDPADYIRRFMARPYRELGRSVIDGVTVEGIEVTDPPTDDGTLEGGVGRMWVDVETELPVKIELEGKADGQAVQWVLEFKWAEAVDPAVFEPNIPSDYTSPSL